MITMLGLTAASLAADAWARVNKTASHPEIIHFIWLHLSPSRQPGKLGSFLARPMNESEKKDRQGNDCQRNRKANCPQTHQADQINGGPRCGLLSCCSIFASYSCDKHSPDNGFFQTALGSRMNSACMHEAIQQTDSGDSNAAPGPRHRAQIHLPSWTRDMASVGRWMGQRDGSIPACCELGGVGVGEVYRALDDLVGADRGPIQTIGGVIYAEPPAIRPVHA
jgi:hypothetical protein